MTDEIKREFKWEEKKGVWKVRTMIDKTEEFSKEAINNIKLDLEGRLKENASQIEGQKKALETGREYIKRLQALPKNFIKIWEAGFNKDYQKTLSDTRTQIEKVEKLIKSFEENDKALKKDLEDLKPALDDKAIG